MDSLATLTTFLGWCSVINLGLLILASLFLMAARGWVTRIHGGMFGLDESDLARAYFQYLAQFKIVVLVFNVAPYVALRIMA